jgi:hypothetical protein
VGGDLVVDLSHGLDLGLNLFLVEGVQEHLHVLLSVKGHSGRLASDGGGVALFNILNKIKKRKHTISSKTAAWTAVRVLLLGLF